MSTSATPARDVLVSVRDAAQRCGVDERTVRRWIESGRLPADQRRRGYRSPSAALTPSVGGDGDMAAGLADRAAVLRADDTGGRTDRTDMPAAPPAVSALDVALAEVADLRARLDAREQAEAELRRL